MMNKVAIGTVASILGAGGTFYAWDEGREAEKHEEIIVQMVAGDVELDLQRVELELKLLRSIAERRALSPDEQDRLEYLRSLREILVEQQRSQVG